MMCACSSSSSAAALLYIDCIMLNRCKSAIAVDSAASPPDPCDDDPAAATWLPLVLFVWAWLASRDSLYREVVDVDEDSFKEEERRRSGRPSEEVEVAWARLEEAVRAMGGAAVVVEEVEVGGAPLLLAMAFSTLETTTWQ